MQILDIAIEVPSPTVPISELAGHLELRRSELRLHTWFLGQRDVAIADVPLHEMLLRPARRALEGHDPERLTHLLYAHTVSHVAPPSESVLESVRRALGAHRARSIALSQQNCATAVYSLKIARALLAREAAGAQVLLLAGERAFPAASRVIPGTTVMGEATSATLLGRDGIGDEVLSVRHRTLGRYYTANDISPQLRTEYDAEYPVALAGLMDRVIAEAGLGPGDVTWVFPHNVNRYSWRSVMKHSVLDFSQVYLKNVSELGHCFGADPFINLATARRDGDVAPGDHVLLATAGLGATFSVALLRTGEHR